MSDVKEPTAKVLFRVVGEEGSVDIETLWAYDLGNEEYQIDNSPYYAYGVSCGDTVLAPFDPKEGFPTFEKVLLKSGYRTVRILFDPPVVNGNISDKQLKELVDLGCDYEGANPKYIVVNIPKNIDLQTIVQFMVAKELNWEHADPTYEEYHGE